MEPKKFDPNERGKFYAVKKHDDPERVPMLILLIGVAIVFAVFLVWAVR